MKVWVINIYWNDWNGLSYFCGPESNIDFLFYGPDLDVKVLIISKNDH